MDVNKIYNEAIDIYNDAAWSEMTFADAAKHAAKEAAKRREVSWENRYLLSRKLVERFEKERV
jgi:hypothetical protein